VGTHLNPNGILKSDQTKEITEMSGTVRIIQSECLSLSHFLTNKSYILQTIVLLNI